jgi:hypothetical protein
MEAVRRAHIADLTADVEGGGGRVVKTLGDGARAAAKALHVARI